MFAQHADAARARNGDFSKSFNVNGGLIAITDPQTATPFPGNPHSESRMSSLGLSILNFYPLPNYTRSRSAQSVPLELPLGI
jgi:hypothetical protein